MLRYICLLLSAVIAFSECSDPAFLTPLIKDGKIAQAKQLSKVGTIPGISITSYTGFITVNETYNSNLFFWYFPSQDANAPVLVWLQGGPGGSSIYGLFNENGPFSVNDSLNIETREYAWTNNFSVVYIDNPVGAGYSFTDQLDGYAKNEDDVAQNLYEFLQQFFTLFNEQRSNPLYITGESYAGKYVPAISYKIHVENPKAENKINFQGMAIGDGLCDPINQMGYDKLLYEMGLIDEKTRDSFEEMRQAIKYFIERGDYYSALTSFDELILGGGNDNSMFGVATGLDNYYNFVTQRTPDTVSPPFTRFLNQTNVRDAIHIGNLQYSDGNVVQKYLMNDIMRSVKPWVQTIMENYRVMLYNGQLDIIVAPRLTYNFVNSIEWSGADKYKNAHRQIWKVSPTDDQVAGYVKQSGDFYVVLVRNAGHMVPYDQPRAALDMIQKFVFNETWSS